MRAEQRKPELRLALGLAAAVLTLCLCARAASKYDVLYNLPYPDDGVVGSVTVDVGGNVFAETGNGGGGKNCGEYGCGLIFELTPQAGKGTFSVVHDFTGGRDGGGSNGNLYGTTPAGGRRGGGTVFELRPGADGWSLTLLHSFCNQQGCVGLTQSGVVMDSVGNLYGTTRIPDGGGAYGLAKASGHWKETTLHRFCPKGPPCSDGTDPYAGLTLDSSGNLYGTTSYGGTGCGGDGCGTVYELSLDPDGKWKETILHHFDNNGVDGVSPGGGALLMDALGNLYGTTEAGGANVGCAGASGLKDARGRGQSPAIGNCGTVFELTENSDGRWKETILHDFALGTGGYLPGAGVVMDQSGNL